jgi:hypothetical protein
VFRDNQQDIGRLLYFMELGAALLDFKLPQCKKPTAPCKASTGTSWSAMNMKLKLETLKSAFMASYKTGVEGLHVNPNYEAAIEEVREVCEQGDGRKALLLLRKLVYESPPSELDISPALLCLLESGAELPPEAVVWLVIAHCPARAHYSFSDLRSLAATSVHFRAMLSILGPYWIAVNQNLGGTCVQQPSSSNSGRACIHISHYLTELQQCSQSFISAVAAAADCAFPGQLKVWAFAACDPAELKETVPQGIEVVKTMHLCMATRTLNVYDILEKLRPECSPKELVLLAAQFIKDKVLDAASTHNNSSSSSSSGYLKKLAAVQTMMDAIEANPTLDNLEQLTHDLRLEQYGFTIAQCKKGGTATTIATTFTSNSH